MHDVSTPIARRAILIPGILGVGLGALLGTLGFFTASFGMGTICTDFNSSCDALMHWLETGLIGQWMLVLATAVMLTVGLVRPRTRQPLAIAAWIALAVTIAWYCFYFYSGYHSFKNH